MYNRQCMRIESTRAGVMSCIFLLSFDTMTENDSAEKGHKKRRISLLLKDRPRFKCVSQNEVLMLEKKTVPKTTEYSTRWAMKVQWFMVVNHVTMVTMVYRLQL